MLGLVLLMMVQIAHAGDALTVRTTSTDTSKQCTSGVTTQTKTGETGLTMEFIYVTGIIITPNDFTVALTLPKLYAQYEASSLSYGGTVGSLFNTADLSVKMIEGTTTYWPAKVETSIGALVTDTDTITATFKSTTSLASIASGSSVTFYVTGAINPVSTETQSNFGISITVSATSDTQASVVGLTPCAYEQTLASAMAVIGTDRVGQTGTYRFRFKSVNTYPSTHGFRVTMPETITNTDTADYTMTCNTGCTVTTVTPTISGAVLTYQGAFTTAFVAAGTVIELEISGWTNPSVETAYSVSYEIIWGSSDYAIDKFENLGAITTNSSIYDQSSTFGNTHILITSKVGRGVDCRIKAPILTVAAQAITSDTTQTTVDVESATQQFATSGDDCYGRNSFVITAYARSSDGKRLNQLYAVATIGWDGYIEVVLTPSYDTTGKAASHAVYVQVTDLADKNSTNVFCFMKTDTTGEDFCRTICQEQQLTADSSNRVESLEYRISGSAVSYTDGEFSMVSSNPIMCPVLFTQSVTNSHGLTSQAVNNYSTSTGAFNVYSATTGMASSTTQSYELYTFTAITEGFTKTMPFTIYFESSTCSESAYLIPQANFTITAMMASGSTIDYTDVGFESSDPANCAVSDIATIDYTFCTDTTSTCTATSLADYWDTNSEALQMTRTASTTLDTDQNVYIKATYDSMTVTNKIAVRVSDCSSTWSCASCDPSTLSTSLLSDVQYVIGNYTTGCMSCATGYFLEYKIDSTDSNYYMQCTADLTTSRRLTVATEGAGCATGYVYEYDSTGTLACTRTCADAINGCTLCSSSTECTLCSNPLYTPSTFLNSLGTSFSACTTNLCVGCPTQSSCPTNCEVCSNFSGTLTCQACDSTYYLQSDGTCSSAAVTGTLTLTYYVADSTQNTRTSSKFDYAYATIEAATGTSTDKFYFLQQAFNKVYSDTANLAYEKVTVNIIMDEGDHFFFSCHNDLYSNYTINATYTSADFTNLCSQTNKIGSLEQINPPADNYEFVITSAATTGTTTIIHVLDSYAHFNVTGSLSFTNIEFRGENALAKPVDYSSLTHPPISTIPEKKCTVVTAPDGTHTALTFTELLTTETLLNAKFSCTDAGFQAATVPMVANVTCAQTDDSSTVESVRACTGEPYHEDFFVFDSVTGVAYKRHRVLFNMFNFDRQRSWTPDNRATLTLSGCNFYYFLADYEALIYVETNNMAVVQPPTADSSPYIEELGDDRGVIISITDSSEFKYSRFCKGLLAFKKRPKLTAQYDALIYGLYNNNQATSVPDTDNSAITITSSTFENLNYGKTLATISLLNNSTQPIAALTSVEYPVLDNHGSVLNIQGFPGTITITSSTFTKNMVFIPDIYPSKRSKSDEYETFDGYLNAVTGQLMTTRCNDTFVTRRFFSDYLSSLNEQPGYELSQLEKHSAIYISYSENPLIMSSNTFESNVGLFGGAVSIDSPNYVDADFSQDVHSNVKYRPYIMLEGNTFQYNQAYLSGNAVHARFTRQEGVSFDTKQACGAGTRFKLNYFLDNAPIIHASNGGAVSLECDFVSTEASERVGASQTAFTNWYDENVLDDTASYATLYDIPLYAATFLNNTFTSNAVGQKGSAIYARQISFLIVKQNIFQSNVPIYSTNQNNVKMPYYLYLAQQLRSLFFHETQFIEYTDEFDYMQWLATDYADGGLIDMPQLQGLIYTESCRTCLVDYEPLTLNQGNDCKFCFTYSYGVNIEDNTFIDNQDGVTFWEEHNLPRASHLYADGPGSYNVTNNDFLKTGSMFEVYADEKLETYTAHLPNDYFNHLQSPMFRINIPEGIDTFYEDLLDTTIALDKQIYMNRTTFNVANITVTNNLFSTVAAVQPFIANQSFKGSIFHVESASINARFNMTSNAIDDCFSLGGDNALVYVEGAALVAEKNVFRRSGHLDTSTQNFTQDYNYPIGPDYFPVNSTLWSSRTWSQSKGVFWLKSIDIGSYNASQPVVHNLTSNTFTYLFCDSGCVATQDMPDNSHPTYIEFYNNSYSDIIATKGGIYHLNVAKQSDNITYAVVNATKETITRVQNGAFLIDGYRHETIVTMQNMTVIDAFSSANHAAFVHTSYGALITCHNCTATQTIDSSNMVSTIQAAFVAENFAYYLRERNNFYEYIAQATADTIFAVSSNQKGLIHLESMSYYYVKQLEEIEVNGLSIGERMNNTYNPIPYIISGYWRDVNQTWHPLEGYPTLMQTNWIVGVVDFVPDSLLINCTFSNYTVQDSLIQVNDAGLQVRSSSFTSNNATATESSIILVKNGFVNITYNSNFTSNEASTGGAIRLGDRSTFLSNETDFSSNTARRRGGAIMAIDESYIEVNSSSFYNNSAEGGSAISVENVQESSAMVYNSSFSENSATKALILLSSANMVVNSSSFENNQATLETPGFSLSTSRLIFTNSTISDVGSRRLATRARTLQPTGSFAEQEMNKVSSTFDTAKISAQNQVTSGFFYVTNKSNFQMSDSTQTGTLGAVASAIYASTESEVFVSNVTFEGLLAPRDCKLERSGVIVAELSKSIEVTSSTFDRNDCSNIYSDRSDLQVTGTTFSNGLRNSYILLKGGALDVQTSKFNSATSDSSVLGRGINCQSCSSVLIQFNEFDNLQGFLGGALYIKDSLNGVLDGNTITSNLAAQGGGLYVQNSVLDLEYNEFRNNEAKAPDFDSISVYRNLQKYINNMGTGGAIFYTCLIQNPLDTGNKYEDTTCNSGDNCDLTEFNDDLEEKKLQLKSNTDDTCNLKILQDNKFADNKQSNKTNSDNDYQIYFTDKKIKLEADIDCSSGGELYINKRCVNGIPTKLEFSIRGEEGKDFNVDEQFRSLTQLDWPDKQSRVARIKDRIYFNSGDRLTLNITIITEDGNTFVEDTRSTASIAFERECGEDDLPSECNYKALSLTTVTALEGVYTFADMRVTQRPGSTEYLKISFGDKFANYGADLSFLKDDQSPLLLFQARTCKRGEKYTYQGTCELCPKDTYTFIPQVEPMEECPACPLNSLCPGDAKLYPAKGHVRFHEDSQITVACFSSESCLEGNAEFPLQNCQEGYGGVMCATCSEGYWKPKNSFECYPCIFEGSSQIGYSCGVILIFLIILFLAYRQQIRNFDQPQQEGLAVFRILTNQYHFLHILNVMQDSQYTISPYILLKHAVDTYDQAVNPLSAIVSYDCMGVLKGDQVTEHFYMQVVIMVCLPAATLFMISSLYFIGTLVTKYCKSRAQTPKINYDRLLNRISIVTGAWLYLIYPSVIETLVQSVNCFPSLEETGPSDTPVMRLKLYPDIKCDDPKYVNYLWFCFIPGLIIYVFVIPILAAYKMMKNSSIIFFSGEKEYKTGNPQQLRQINQVKSMYGFFFAGLKLGDDTNEEEQAGEDDEEETPKCKLICGKIMAPIAGSGVKVSYLRGKKKHVVHSWFYWEFVLYFQKTFLLALVIYMNDFNEGIQICIIQAMLAFYQFLHIRNTPYYTATLNSLQSLMLAMGSSFMALRLMIRTFGLNLDLIKPKDVLGAVKSLPISPDLVEIRRIPYEEDVTTQVYGLIFVWLFFFLAVQFYFLWVMYIHFLLLLLKSDQTTQFTFFSCNREPKAFRAKYQTQDFQEQHLDDVLPQKEVKIVKRLEKKEAKEQLAKKFREREAHDHSTVKPHKPSPLEEQMKKRKRKDNKLSILGNLTDQSEEEEDDYQPEELLDQSAFERQQVADQLIDYYKQNHDEQFNTETAILQNDPVDPNESDEDEDEMDDAQDRSEHSERKLGISINSKLRKSSIAYLEGHDDDPEFRADHQVQHQKQGNHQRIQSKYTNNNDASDQDINLSGIDDGLDLSGQFSQMDQVASRGRKGPKVMVSPQNQDHQFLRPNQPSRNDDDTFLNDNSHGISMNVTKTHQPVDERPIRKKDPSKKSNKARSKDAKSRQEENKLTDQSQKSKSRERISKLLKDDQDFDLIPDEPFKSKKSRKRDKVDKTSLDEERQPKHRPKSPSKHTRKSRAESGKQKLEDAFFKKLSKQPIADMLTIESVDSEQKKAALSKSPNQKQKIFHNIFKKKRPVSKAEKRYDK